MQREISESSEFCAEQSREIEQPIFGTASEETTVWLLLEYNRPWAGRAVEDNDLPAPVQGWLAEQLAAIPQSRLVFIKHDSKKLASITFFVAIAREKEQRLYRLTLDSYDDLLPLDLDPLLAGEPEQDKNLVDHPIFLVCTNGKRDRCCTKFGLPVYKKLAAGKTVKTDQVWQCTHLGGHRYAAVTAVFPQGLYYRILDPDHDLNPLVAASENGKILLEGFRGRNCYPKVVQAADYFIRRLTDNRFVNGLSLVEAQEENGVWAVAFDDANGRDRHAVRLQVDETEPLLIGCSKGKSSSEPRYRLLQYYVEQS